MVALSVSTSASISPDFTSSPTFFNQEAMVPSSMVSLILGIGINSALIPEVSISAATAVGAASAAGAASSAAGAAPLPPAVAWLNTSVISSPFSPMMAITPSTGTESFSFTPM